MILQATLVNGSVVIGEFARLVRVHRYLALVFSGQKTFNVWRIQSTTHPVTGEPFLTRTCEMLPGAQIASVREVQRKSTAAPDSFAPADFEPVASEQTNALGFFTVPDEGISGEDYSLVTGARYPIHRDPTSLRRFVYARYDERNPQRHYLDPEMAAPEPAWSEREDLDVRGEDEDDDGERF
jgi:hypothetical protein